MVSDDRPASREERARLPEERARLPARQEGLDQPFDEEGLHQLRSAVATHTEALGAGARQAEDLLVIVGELAGNAIRWGGGGGRLRLWRDGQSVVCRVSDTGPGLTDPDSLGRHPPPVAVPHGRGLWIIRQLADEVDIRTGPDGTTITAVVGPQAR